MSETDTAQIYLATPQTFELEAFAKELKSVLDAVPVVCLRISMASTDEAELTRAADTLREICHERDVAIVIDDHYRMVKPLGLDGVHLTSSSRHVREARKELGPDAIIGTYCGSSKHAGITAAEIGTDYISFGPVSDTGGLGDGSIADADLFLWWSEMIEVPVIAEGGVNDEAIAAIKDHIDFLTVGPEIWSAAEGPVEALKSIVLKLR